MPDISPSKNTQRKTQQHQNIHQMLGSVFSNHPPRWCRTEQKKMNWIFNMGTQRPDMAFSGWSCGFVWWYFGLTFTIALPGKPNTKISCGEVGEKSWLMGVFFVHEIDGIRSCLNGGGRLTCHYWFGCSRRVWNLVETVVRIWTQSNHSEPHQKKLICRWWTKISK